MSRATLIKRVADHLAKQRRRALNAGGICQYKAESGAMCAIGGILPPELYTPRMEGMAVSIVMHTTQEHVGDDIRLRPVLRIADYLREQISDVPAPNQSYVLSVIQCYHDGQDPQSYIRHVNQHHYLNDSQLADVIYYELNHLTGQFTPSECKDI